MRFKSSRSVVDEVTKNNLKGKVKKTLNKSVSEEDRSPSKKGAKDKLTKKKSRKDDRESQESKEYNFNNEDKRENKE